MTKAISPEQAREMKKTIIPDVVYEVVNELLAERMTTSGRVEIKQEEVIRGILLNCGHELDRETIFKKNYLDFEPAYRDSGWEVYFDKPGYNERYEANWKFKPTHS